ncbi:hypothetical protein H0H81_011509 [Sphagnurus paluster]|uniref:LIM zinc-binding domain-containing protein n=1 Tax=Sphagnurus paluster TaxID=117069 RepID=A0A9P7GHC8_9AGAR|nr:hypothetical protein H0H81_011509 [Sphagnurus paluster]
MHPFGGTQICPRCSKAVYAAEQVMGPGRRLYHKPCLACTFCHKRLDSFTLLEHDEKNFGTRDLRHANLPVRERDPSPPEDSRSPPPRLASPLPLLRPNRRRSLVTSPTRSAFPRDLEPERSTSPTEIDGSTFPSTPDTDINADPCAGADEDVDANTDAEEEARDTVSGSTTPPPVVPILHGTPSHSGRFGPGGLPRSIALPLTPTRNGSFTRPRHLASKSVGGTPIGSAIVPGLQQPQSLTMPSPLLQTATGTRYGAALGAVGAMPLHLTGSSVGSPRRWGAQVPSCPRCGKNVYFAEQVKAIGKTYHKNCLRCTECSTLLDSSRLRDHAGDALCMRCYGKLHGPHGGGYALLGKAGG